MFTKRCLKKDERAVSPVIGVIMMIAITVIIAAVVAAFSYGIIHGVKKTPNAAFVVEGAVKNSRNVTLIHYGGETIIDAFQDGEWRTLQIRMNGTEFSTNCAYCNGAKLNGSSGSDDFETGDELRLQVDWGLKSRDSITVVYTPTDDVLQRVQVP